MRTAAALFAALLALAVFAPSASALDALSLPVAETGPDECPRLIQIKYPWFTCATNAWGGKTITTATVKANVDEYDERVVPLGWPEVEGRGHWQEGLVW